MGRVFSNGDIACIVLCFYLLLVEKVCTYDTYTMKRKIALGIWGCIREKGSPPKGYITVTIQTTKSYYSTRLEPSCRGGSGAVNIARTVSLVD